MAEYVVPQMRIFQEFTPSAAGTVASLGACVLAPHYSVFKQAPAGAYSTGGRSIAYPGLSGGHAVAEGDLAGFKGHIRGALLKGEAMTSSEFSLAGSTLSTVYLLASSVAHAVPVGLPAYQVGDKVILDYDAGSHEEATITGFVNDPLLPIVPYASPVATPLAQTVTVAVASTTITAPKSYRGTITGSFTVGKENPAFIIQDGDGNIIHTSLGDQAAFAGISIGDGLEITFADGDIWWSGDTFTFGVVPAVAGNNAAKLDKAPTASPISASLVRRQDIDLATVTEGPPTAAGEILFTTTGVQLPANLSYRGQAVLGGEVLLDFKALSDVYSGAVFSCGTLAEARDLFGDLTAANPLGAMVAAALLNSNNTAVGFVSVMEDTVAGYREALDKLDEDDASHGIVPFSTAPAIQAAVVAKVNELSGADVMNWKVAWLAYDIPSEETLTDSAVVTGTGANDVTVDGIDLAGVSVGDRVVLGGATAHVKGVTPTTGTLSLDRVVPTGAHIGCLVIHPLTPAEKTALAKAACTWDDHRVRLVVTPGAALADDPLTLASNTYMAAAMAGYRSGVAPHQPLTRAAVSGFVIPGMGGLSATNLNGMASAGIWLVVRDSSGQVLVRHQLTTKTSKYKLREDSKVSNADEVSRFIRQRLQNYYGKANTSDEFIDALYVELSGVAKVIQGRTYSYLLGPQVSEVTPPVITRDPELADRLVVSMRFATPDPANYLDVCLTIA